MKTEELILESLRVLSTWPVLITVVLIALLVSQKKAISRLIDRIIEFGFPGGGLKAREYPPELPKEMGQQVLSSIPTGESKSSPHENTEILARDFNQYLLLDLESNLRIITKLVDVLWAKSGLSLFKGKQIPGGFRAKVQELRNRVDPKAHADLEYIETIMNKQPVVRKELMRACIKSKLLVDYLRGLVTRR